MALLAATRHSLITLLRQNIKSITLLRPKIGLITHYAITHYTFLITLLRKNIGPITHYAIKNGLITPLRKHITPLVELPDGALVPGTYCAVCRATH